MKKLLVAGMIVGLAGLVLLGDLQAQTHDFWKAATQTGVAVTGYRAKDFNSTNYYQGTWSFSLYSTCTAISVTAYDLIQNPTTGAVAIRDSITVVFSNDAVRGYGDVVIADSIKVTTTVGTVTIVCVGDLKDARNVYGD